MKMGDENELDEDDYVSISALQHYVFCKRQAALIHTERVWEENQFTVEGSILHKGIDSSKMEKRGNVLVTRGLFLKSDRLGVCGRADVVEFHRTDSSGLGDEQLEKGVVLSGTSGLWVPFPVEYKRGTRRNLDANTIQLCAQALCLEEMLKTEVRFGAIFYVRSARRQVVRFDLELRERTEKTIADCRELLISQITPKAQYSKRCNDCSLINFCLPKEMAASADIGRYIFKGIFSRSKDI